MNSRPEFHFEINCVNDSRDFQDVESIRSGKLSHVPFQAALFPLLVEPRGLLSRDNNPQPDMRNTHGISGDVFG